MVSLVHFHIMISTRLIHFEHLRRICMHYVSVSGGAHEFFLCNCPHLEELSVSWSWELSTVKIIGPFPALKRLEIVNCHKLTWIEIRDTNIVFFKYYGKEIQHFVLENVPLLVENVPLPLLEKLTIDLPRKFSGEDAMMFASSSVKMPKLKQFWLQFHAADYSYSCRDLC